MVRSVDRKSTRLNSSHLGISYAVFCLKKQAFCPGDHFPLSLSPSTVHDRQGRRGGRTEEGGAARQGRELRLRHHPASQVSFFQQTATHGRSPFSPTAPPPA